MRPNENILNAWQGPINSMANSWKNATLRWSESQHKQLEHASNLTASLIDQSHAFVEQLWQPVLMQMQNNVANPTELWKIFNAGIYRPFMNQLGNWYTEMLRSAQQNVTSLFNPTLLMNYPDGRSSFKLIAHSNRYLNKLGQLQYLLLNTAYSAWNKIVTATNARVHNGKSLTDYNEFYNEWAAINEQVYAELFNSSEFINLQEELIRIQSEIIKQYGRQMEENMKQPTTMGDNYKKQQPEANKPNSVELRSRPNKREREIAQIQ